MLNFLMSLVGLIVRLFAAVLLLDVYVFGYHAVVWSCLIAYLILAFTGWIDLWPGIRLQPLGGKKHAAERLRGAEMATAKAVRRQVRDDGLRWTIELGGVPLPCVLEAYHLLLAGSTGTGKSVAITTTLGALRRRGDRAVIADAGGLFTAGFLQSGDVLLNPLDERAVPWSPLAEIRAPHDFDRLARAMVPDSAGEMGDWRQHAQTLLRVILERVYAEDGTNADLLRLACNAPMEELRETLVGTTAEPMCAPGNEKMFASIRATLTTQVGPLRYLHADAGIHAFSLRRWVERGSGWAFWGFLDDQLDLVRPLIAAMLDTVAVAVLSLPPDDKRRLWLVLDELASLGRITSLEAFLTKARKAGGCAIVGLQSLSQLRSIYGVHETQTLLSCVGSWLVLRTPDPETAEYLSKAQGEEEIRRVIGSGGASDQGNHANWQEQVVRDRLVLAAEIQKLPNRCGYFSLAGEYPVAPIQLKLPAHRSDQAQAFVPRELPMPTPKKPPNTRPPAADEDSEGFVL